MVNITFKFADVPTVRFSLYYRYGS